MRNAASILGIVLAVMVGAVNAIDRVPAVMVSTSTNNYNVLTGKTAQADFDFIDDWLVAESNRLTSVSNLAQSAYDMASVSNGANFGRWYTYETTGTFTVAISTGGQAWCYVSTQSIGRLHAGMAVTGSVFNALTTIDSVDYDTRRINLSLVTRSNGTDQVCSFWRNGTFTHTVPTNWTRCRIVVTGGGASGASDAGSVGGGGGAGGSTIGYWQFNAGETYTVTVGAGGTNVSGSSVGKAGGTSSFGSLQTATGGGASAAGVDGTGGVGAGGQINVAGTTGLTGHGGASIWGGGGLSGHMIAGNGGRGISPGSGGGGAESGGTDISGAGCHGIVSVDYY